MTWGQSASVIGTALVGALIGNGIAALLRPLHWTTRLVLAVVSVLVLTCLVYSMANCATVTLRCTLPGFTADTLHCDGATRAVVSLDSVRVRGVERVRTWRLYPVGWYTPQPRVLASHAVKPWLRGARDSLTFTLPAGVDSVFTVWMETHDRAGWSCPGNLVTVGTP